MEEGVGCRAKTIGRANADINIPTVRNIAISWHAFDGPPIPAILYLREIKRGIGDNM